MWGREREWFAVTLVSAEKIKKVLVDWGIAEKIIACGFDTTSSNTGVHKGCCVILQTLLAKQILWLACRHHIPELIIGAAFATLFGDTKSPEVTLFKVLKDSWDTLDLADLHLPSIPAIYKAEIEELLLFIDSRLQDLMMQIIYPATPWQSLTDTPGI